MLMAAGWNVHCTKGERTETKTEMMTDDGIWPFVFSFHGPLFNTFPSQNHTRNVARIARVISLNFIMQLTFNDRSVPATCRFHFATPWELPGDMASEYAGDPSAGLPSCPKVRNDFVMTVVVLLICSETHLVCACAEILDGHARLQDMLDILACISLNYITVFIAKRVCSVGRQQWQTQRGQRPMLIEYVCAFELSFCVSFLISSSSAKNRAWSNWM